MPFDPSKLTIEDVLARINARLWTTPQPEGAEVAHAYKNGVLDDPYTCLEVIAFLLARVRNPDRPL